MSKIKFLTDYIQEEQSSIFKKYGVFFAFSEKQFLEGVEEKRKEGFTQKFTSIGFGGFAPPEHVKAIFTDLEICHKKGIKQDIEENGIEAIIKRELWNHEAYYTWDITTTKEALEDYPNITTKMIQKVFNENIPDDE